MSVEFDNLHLAIKKQLEKDNSNLTEEELEQKSLKIATSRKIMEDTFDEEGRIIVAENVEFRINAGINTIEE